MRLDSTSRPRARRRALTAGGLAAAAALAVATALTSGAAQAVAQAAPSNTAEPKISGAATAGSTLTTTAGTWSGTTPISFAYQWLRCPTSGGKPDGSDCAAISGATTSSYVLGSGDAGKRIRVRVTATNAEGTDAAASNATATIAGAPSGRPKNTTLPSASGATTVGSTLQGDAGAWTGAQPITFTYRWLRCDAGGNNCGDIDGATNTSYTLQNADVGRTLRFRVFAHNSGGTQRKTGNQTGVVTTAPSNLPPGAIKLPNGEISIPATSVPATERLVVDRVDFSPNPVRTQSAPISIHVKVEDTRGFDVRGVFVFVRSTPLVTSTPGEQQTADDGTVTYTVQPQPTFPIKSGYNVQFFVKAHRQGDKPLAGIAGYRLVQVATAP
jgi:hypothetical protein